VAAINTSRLRAYLCSAAQHLQYAVTLAYGLRVGTAPTVFGEDIMFVRCTLCRGSIGLWDDAELYGHADDGQEIGAHVECDADVLAVVGDKAPFGIIFA
jgi:hypothetical protein